MCKTASQTSGMFAMAVNTFSTGFPRSCSSRSKRVSYFGPKLAREAYGTLAIVLSHLMVCGVAPRRAALELIADVSSFHVDEFAGPGENNAVGVVLLVYDAEMVQASK